MFVFNDCDHEYGDHGDDDDHGDHYPVSECRSHYNFKNSATFIQANLLCSGSIFVDACYLFEFIVL